MAEERILNPNLAPTLGKAIHAAGLARLWESAAPLPGGRGTARLLELAGAPFVVKRERRGGWGGKVLPDRYVRRSPFLREWELACDLSRRGLAPEPAALEFVGRALGFEVYAMSGAVLPSRSLAEIWRGGELDGPVLSAAGRAVALLHREGVLHGDLNAGNLLFTPQFRPVFLDLRHSRQLPPPLAPASRRANFLRLCRSLHKLGVIHRLALPESPGESLASGYAEGWGEAEPWLGQIVSVMARPLSSYRRLFWSR